MPDKLGWMEPIYYDFGPDGPVAVFSDEDFEKMRLGYACPNCWQSFTMALLKCPVCQQDLTRSLDEHIREMPEFAKPSADDPDYKLKDRRHG